MPVDYSKWDNLELSDDSDIEVHPNVDKRSFIRAKQNQIHQEREQRKHQIETLKYERIVNDGLLTRIDALIKALKAHAEAASTANPDQLVFQSLIESAGDPADDQPPPRPEGVHANVEEQPTYSRMMAALVDQVKKAVDEQKPTDRLDGYIKEVGTHKTKVLDLQQQLLATLSDLEKKDTAKITSESIKFGFNSSHVAKAASSTPAASTASNQTSSVELLNSPQPRAPASVPDAVDSGAEADVEDEDVSDQTHQASALGKAFGRLPRNDYRAYLNFISQNPAVLAERETDGLLMQAFDAQLAGKDDDSRQCVHQALLLQYCRTLGRDGVGLFFRRITTQDHQARKVFHDDVNGTYARLRERAKAMAQEDTDGEEREQIQLHAVTPGQQIAIRIPDPADPDHAEARKAFDSFAPDMRRALESGSLDQVNAVLGRMRVAEAEELVGVLSESGMLSMEEGVIDATTDEGRERVRALEDEGRREQEQDQAPKSVDQLD